MREKEFKKLLDREKHTADVKQHFSSQLNALTELINYGTWLIPRAYDSSEKKLSDVILIAVLFKQVVSMLDAIEILISNGAVHPAFLPARTAFEASIYIDWILKGNEEEKVKYYYVSNLRNDRLWSLRILGGTYEQREFTADIRDLASHLNFESPDTQQMAKRLLSNVEKILNQESFKTINSRFDAFKNKKKREPYWYQLIQERSSLRRLAKNVNRGSEYVFFYERGSKATHSASYKDHVKFSKGGAFVFEPIRNLSEIRFLLQFIIAIALQTYISIINKYRHGELQNFTRKYVKDWRQSFMQIPSVEYKSPEGDKV
jgi:hypothetical protein